MIGGKGEDSCGKSGIGETPQERTRRGGSSAARAESEALHGNQQRCNKPSILAHLSHLFVFRLK
ncbi:hypothetical protein V8V54_18600 [Priestia megaterium]|uniref:hypothetical protein n=1 Tax=Priestia megaterium TaxID=1404 RepID=UPI00159BE47C|nr:hypothetical protein [Priestia megaterium]MCM3153358.1 hypothetical protein [Priestia megaterium]